MMKIDGKSQVQTIYPNHENVALLKEECNM